jgi:hypothetical protein
MQNFAEQQNRQNLHRYYFRVVFSVSCMQGNSFENQPAFQVNSRDNVLKSRLKNGSRRAWERGLRQRDHVKGGFVLRCSGGRRRSHLHF